MRGIGSGPESNNVFSRTNSSNFNFSNNNYKQYWNSDFSHHGNSDDFGESQKADNLQLSNEVLNTPSSTYDNYSVDIKVGPIKSNTRQSRQLNQWDDKRTIVSKQSVKRDLSVPPINCRERQLGDEDPYIHTSLVRAKYSIDCGLNSQDDIDDFVLCGGSLTPPPVEMVQEYANRKAIICPLAFRPVRSDRAQNVLHPSPTKTAPFTKQKVSIPRRTSPPPVPPHANRKPRKSNIGRVHSLKSGDSSGYYSSRTACTVNGMSSSTDISPTMDDNSSLIDSIMIGDIYVNSTDLMTDCPRTEEIEQEQTAIKLSLDAEISAERERNRTLEGVISMSNIKLLNAESQIIELKMRLSQKSSDVNNTVESLNFCKRSLDHQTQKYRNLEKTLLALQTRKSDGNKERVTREKMTQTNLYGGDCTSNKLIERFEDEKRTWLDEKQKVLTYQRQMETNFQKLVFKCRRSETELVQLRHLVKECRARHSQSAQHFEDHDKSSLNSSDSYQRGHFLDINRLVPMEHQSSF